MILMKVAAYSLFALADCGEETQVLFNYIC